MITVILGVMIGTFRLSVGHELNDKQPAFVVLSKQAIETRAYVDKKLSETNDRVSRLENRVDNVEHNISNTQKEILK